VARGGARERGEMVLEKREAVVRVGVGRGRLGCLLSFDSGLCFWGFGF
jgi:hypothetical protein